MDDKQEIFGKMATYTPPEKENPLQHNVLQGIRWARQDLNLRPTDYESAALTTELRARTAASPIERLQRAKKIREIGPKILVRILRIEVLIWQMGFPIVPLLGGISISIRQMNHQCRGVLFQMSHKKQNPAAV